MGIQVHAIKLIDKTLEKFTTPNDEVQIIDWGNSYIKPSTQEWINDENNKNYKLNYSQAIPNFQIRRPKDHSNAWVSGDFFKSHKYKYNAIDLNGKEESFEIDLRQDITRYSIPGSDGYSMLEGIINFANIIIDCGTSEHVNNQYYNFKNAYNILKIGGYAVHCLPKKGYWKDHCKYKYEKKFFKQLAKLCDYEIIELFEYEESEYRADICCVFKKKKNSKFPSIKEFKKIPIHVEKGEEFNDRKLYGYAYKKGKLRLFKTQCPNCNHYIEAIAEKEKDSMLYLLSQLREAEASVPPSQDIIYFNRSQSCPRCGHTFNAHVRRNELRKMWDRLQKYETNNEWPE